jgi:hypothetical protein
MGFPLGDILRAFIKSGPIRKVLDAIRGSKVTLPGGTEILLDRDGNPMGGGGIYAPKESPFDKTQHRPGPIIVNGPRR